LRPEARKRIALLVFRCIRAAHGDGVLIKVIYWQAALRVGCNVTIFLKESGGFEQHQHSSNSPPECGEITLKGLSGLIFPW